VRKTIPLSCTEKKPDGKAKDLRRGLSVDSARTRIFTGQLKTAPSVTWILMAVDFIRISDFEAEQVKPPD